jgi:hypothetical protein
MGPSLKGKAVATRQMQHLETYADRKEDEMLALHTGGKHGISTGY